MKCSTLVLLLLVGLFAIMGLGGVAAAPPAKTIQEADTSLTISTNLGDYAPLNQNRMWMIHVVNNTGFKTSDTTCYLHIHNEDGNGGYLYTNETSTSSNFYYTITAPASVHSEKGQYSFKAMCNSTGGEIGFYESTYYVSENGQPFADDFMETSIYLLFLVIIFVFTFTLIINTGKLATASTNLYDVALSFGVYFIIIATYFMGNVLLLHRLVENITGALIAVGGFTHIILPLVSLIITMIKIAATKKRNMSVEELIGRRLLR